MRKSWKENLTQSTALAIFVCRLTLLARKRFTAKQLEDFNAAGFISPVTIFDAPGLREIRGYIDELLGEEF